MIEIKTTQTRPMPVSICMGVNALLFNHLGVFNGLLRQEKVIFFITNYKFLRLNLVYHA